jgi:hypothetical protein
MSRRSRPKLNLLTFGAVPVLAATLGCDPQGSGPVWDAVGAGVSETITKLT